MIEVEMKGTEELHDRFNRLADAVQTKIGQKVVKAGLHVLVAAGQAAVPPAETPGHDNSAIRKSIRGRLIDGGRANAVTGKVAIGAPHAHLYVLGTAPRYTGQRMRKVRGRLTTRPTGNHRAFRGQMPPNDFFRPAVDSAEPAAVAEMQEAFETEVAAEFNR